MKQTHLMVIACWQQKIDNNNKTMQNFVVCGSFVHTVQVDTLSLVLDDVFTRIQNNSLFCLRKKKKLNTTGVFGRTPCVPLENHQDMIAFFKR